MAKVKSERHHWWPECVSRHWADDEGKVNWLLPSGEVRRAPPKQFGLIGNGHIIKIGPNSSSPWDESFESQFDRADNDFPSIIEWLQSLSQIDRTELSDRRQRFVAQPATEAQLVRLAECVISLAVRSPQNRESAVSVAEHFRGPLPERERNALIGMNMRESQRRYVQSIGGRGKWVVIYSPDREFTYGDGFFHNLLSPAGNPINPKILAPITPRLAVLHSSPTSYTVEPRLMTLQLAGGETAGLNFCQQVYAAKAIFYRNDAPPLSSEFEVGEHRRFTTSENPADDLLDDIPGVQRRDRALERLLREASRNSRAR